MLDAIIFRQDQTAEMIADVEDFYIKNKISPPSSLFDVLTDTYYFAKNRQGQFVYANKLLNERFKLNDSKEVLGKTDYDFFRVDIADNIRSDDIKVMDQDIIIENKPEVLQNENGQLHWLFTTKAPLKNSSGEIVGVEGFSRDADRALSSIEPYNAFKECIQYLQQHYMDNISVEYFAQISCMSLSTFERKFKKHFGCTPKQYIKRFRIQESCRMLISGYSIQRAAIDCGFCDQSYFTREFRILMGVTPKNYQAARCQQNS
jgi:AraC-like DNA-binding protein